jgi:hypothetical protein
LLLLGGVTAIAVGGSDTPTAPATDKPAAATGLATEASGTGGAPVTTDGGDTGKDKNKKDLNGPIPALATTTTTGTPKKGKKAANTTTIAGVPVGHPKGHPKPPVKHKPVRHKPKHTGGSTPTPTTTAEPTPTSDTPPTTTSSSPPPATTSESPPPTTTAIAGPPPSTTTTSTTTPCRPSATGRPCP